MPFQPAPNVAKVVLEYTQGSNIAMNIFHVKTGNTWTSEHLENLCQLFALWWEEEVAATVSNEVSLTGIRARDLTEEFDDEHIYAGDLPIPGTVANPVLPFNSTIAIKWASNLTGRSTRGRTFHVGLSESSAVGGLVTVGAQAALTSAYSDLLTRLNADSEPWFLVVLSRVQDGATLPEALAYPILTATIDFALDSMRRRLPGRGI